MDWLTACMELRGQGEAAVLVTVARVRGHAPREAGAKMVVTVAATHDSVGGGNLEATAVERARRLLEYGRVEPEELTMRLNEHADTTHGTQCCGGEVTLLLEPLPARATVAVFGVGHVGHELARVLARLPLILHLVDSRGQQVSDERLAVLDGPADVRDHETPAPETVLATLPPGAHVLVMSHDHAEDLVLCDAALRRGDLGSIGLIGSAAKWARFRSRLLDAGHAPELVDRIECPIGVPQIPGKSPAIIAISVAADLAARLSAEPTAATVLREVGT